MALHFDLVGHLRKARVVILQLPALNMFGERARVRDIREALVPPKISELDRDRDSQV